MLGVKFAWLDSHGRNRRQTLTTTEATIAGALVEVTAFVALFDAISDGGLTNISISTTDNSDAFVAGAGSNVDVNASLQVQGADGFKYDLNVPMIADAFVAGGSVVITDLAVVAFTNQFLAAGKWRMNNRFPTAITAVLSGTLDK